MDKITTVLIIITVLLLVCYLNNETNSKIAQENGSYMEKILRKDMVEGFIDEMKDKIVDKLFLSHRNFLDVIFLI